MPLSLRAMLDRVNVPPALKRVSRRGMGNGGFLRAGARQGPRGAADDSVAPESVIWIFGTGRSGSTWLASMMESLDTHAMWNEPLVGNLFGNFYYFRTGDRRWGKHSILAEPYKEVWLRPIRDLVLRGAAARFPETTGDTGGYLVVKEPNGSIGAPLLMEALPESRMIFLVRDPRDVVASSLDARSEGSWLHERTSNDNGRRRKRPDKNPNSYARTRASSYVQQIEKTREAYDAHRGLKVLVKYEELRADTLGTMKRIYSALEIPVDRGELARVVEKHAWENIPEEQKGEGKIHRKATPGGWREDLTPRQVKIVEDITAHLLKEFYPDGSVIQDAGRSLNARDQ